MTDAELIAMLRNNVGVSEAACRAAKAAADRIEQLVAERDAATAAAYEVAAREVECGCGAGPCQDTANCAAEDAAAIRALATPDQTAALDKLIAEAVKPYIALLKRWQDLGCPNCNGDCSHANPPIYSCIMQETSKAILSASKKGGA